VAGDLRRAGDSISLAARLVDETEGRSLWAVRDRGSSAEFFALCERLVSDLCDQLDAQIREAERERAIVAPPGHLGAWGLYHRGMWHAFRFDAAELDRAEGCFAQVLALAPDFGLAHAGLGYAAIVRAVMLWAPDAPAVLARGLDHARSATAHDPVSPFVSMVHGRLLLMHGETGAAFDLLTAARDRHPSYAHLQYCLALSHHGAGEPDLALEAIDRAIRLSPRDPLMSMFLTVRAGSLYFTDRPAEAEAAARAAPGISRTDVWALTMLAVILAEQGEAAQARALLTGADGAFPDQAGATIWPLIRRTVAPQAADRVRRAQGAGRMVLENNGLIGF
jgi:predicted Zn-dependent protease